MTVQGRAPFISRFDRGAMFQHRTAMSLFIAMLAKVGDVEKNHKQTDTSTRGRQTRSVNGASILIGTHFLAPQVYPIKKFLSDGCLGLNENKSELKAAAKLD